ncbi:MAG TPA: BA14K family protein [Woeseiaceae bacterium]|nr:BA14K family protein [Woeseiaceae bacterium]
MKKLLSTACAMALALPLAATSMAPVNAAPVFVPAPQTVDANIIKVDHTKRHERLQERRAERREDKRERRAERREDRRDFRRAIRRGNHWYYNGYRGYDRYRPGYRRHGDFWFPSAAFGIVIETRPAARVRVGNAHVEWCYDRYRSYRAYDNTFQPYNGPRRQCYSPYS